LKDRELLNEDVIEHGFAVAAMTYEHDQKRDFRKDQSIAEKSRLGVWSVVSAWGDDAIDISTTRLLTKKRLLCCCW
jgi:endonuclease YncB( thermonuclease family)